MNAQAILGIIHNALNANIAFLDEAAQYTTSFCNMLKIFLRYYNSIPMEVPNINKKIPMILRVEREHIIENPEPTLTSSWKKIAKAIFCNEPIVSIIDNIENNLTANINELKAKYSGKIGVIEQSIQNSCADLANIEQQYQLLYQEYEKLCQSIEKYHGNPSTKDKYDKLKFKYKGTQKAAVDKLVELNHQILEYNLQIERLLTKYEEAEKEKYDDLYSCVVSFSQTLKSISEINKKITNNVSNEVSTISPQNDVDKFVDDDALQKVPSRITLSRKGSISGSFNSTEAIIRLEQNLNAKGDGNNALSPQKATGSTSVANSPTKTQEGINNQNDNANQTNEATQNTQQKEEVQQNQQKEETQLNEAPQAEPQQNDINQQDNQKEPEQQNIPNDQIQQTQQVQTRSIEIEPSDLTQQNNQNESTQQNEQKQEEPQQTEQNNEINQNEPKQEEQTLQVQSNEQNEKVEQNQLQNEANQNETQNQTEEKAQNTQQNEQKQIPLNSLSYNQDQKPNDSNDKMDKFPSLTTSSGTENFSLDNSQATSTEDQIGESNDSPDPETTFFEITKMFTFDVNKYLSPEEIFKASLNSFNAVLTEDCPPFHKGDEVTALSTESYKGVTVIDREGQKGLVDMSKLQKVFERKIMKVQTQIEEGELEVEVGEYVLVVNEREGFSKCLSAYREEGIILSNKLVPYQPK